MSGSSDYTDCPRCGVPDSLHTYSDWKPHDLVSGTCVECGLDYYTETGLVSLADVNEMRLELELPPLTELAKPTQAWLDWGPEPRPEERRTEYREGDVIDCPVCGGDIDCEEMPEKGKCLKCGLEVESRRVLVWREK